MASGKTHDFLNMMSLPVFLYGVPHEYFLYFASAYTISTILLSPDIDLKHSYPSKRWKYFRHFWHPYRKLFKHRGLSHFPLVGTLSRLFYAVFIGVILYIFIILSLNFLHEDNIVKSLNTNIKYVFNRLKEDDVIWFFIGAVMADIVHLFWDAVFSIAKKIKNKIF